MSRCGANRLGLLDVSIRVVFRLGAAGLPPRGELAALGRVKCMVLGRKLLMHVSTVPNT